MPRWDPDAPERLALAALELFAEQGYERTTVIEIAERAGLTKSTFFRHFRDKREVLFGGGTLAELLADAIAAAPGGAAPLEAVARAFDAAGAEPFSARRHAFVARRAAVVAATPELQEREALKEHALVEAMAAALEARGTPEPTAAVAARLGALAMGRAYARWIKRDGEDFAALARKELESLRTAAAAC